MLFRKVILVFVHHFLSTFFFKIELLSVCLFISKFEKIYRIDAVIYNLIILKKVDEQDQSIELYKEILD